MALASWLSARGRRPAPAEAAGPAAVAAERADEKPEDQATKGLWATVRAMAERVGRLGIEVTEIDGRIEQVAGRTRSQSELVGSTDAAVRKMSEANARITEAAQATNQTARAVSQAMNDARSTVKTALQTILGLVDGVAMVEAKLPGLQESLEQVSKVSKDIKKIADQTNLLALNATIEAARAGEAGKGFAVVATEVKNLSGQTANAVTLIQTTLANLSGQIDTLIRESRAASHIAAAARSGTGDIGNAVNQIEGVSRDLGQVKDQLDAIVQAATENQAQCQEIVGDVEGIEGATKQSLGDIEVAKARTLALLTMSEDLIALTADAGVETLDTPYINLVVQQAGEVSQLFEAAVAERRIGEGDLFDTDYRPVPGVEPPHYLTRATEFCAKLLAARLDAVVASSPQIIACTVGDVNNYYPIINSTFAKPPTNDAKWNAANSRARTRQLDRTSLNQFRTKKPFLVQTYRRNMGDRFDLMKNFSAPIMVKGRQWGVLRVMVRAG